MNYSHKTRSVSIIFDDVLLVQQEPQKNNKGCLFASDCETREKERKISKKMRRGKQEVTAKPTMLNVVTGSFEWGQLAEGGSSTAAEGNNNNGRPIRRRSLSNIRTDDLPWQRNNNNSDNHHQQSSSNHTPRVPLEPLPHRPPPIVEEPALQYAMPAPQRLEPLPVAPQPLPYPPPPPTLPTQLSSHQFSPEVNLWRVDDLMALIDRNGGEARHSYLRV